MILVTGGCGMIGSHLVDTLLQTEPCIVLDRLDYCASTKSLHPNAEFVKGSITDFDLVVYLLRKHSVDKIVHLAAQTHVDNSFGISFEFTQTNVLGTHILLEAVRMHPVKLFVHVSTDEVYGETNQANEESLLQPTNPYAATKAAAECLVNAYHKSFQIPTIITRSNNVYGPRQYPEKIIPKFICRALDAQSLPIHGDGSHTRRYLYVSDVVNALTLILEKGTPGQIYNISSQTELSNHKIADIIRSNINQHLEIEFVQDRQFNDQHYNIDGQKLYDLGWRQEVAFEDGLERTIEWYREHRLDWWEDWREALAPHPKKRHSLSK
ncbi:hypothetical protein EDD86DRAFT_232948 [Gorgonomyces haynaldii]|nr:hypothetical protein EDD86DRAFT_232948 [Gorgonomyces haynaldii]